MPASSAAPRPARQPPPGALAAVAVAIASAAGLVALHAPWPPNPPEARFNPDHVALFSMVDNSAARQSYVVALVALLAASGLFWALRRGGRLRSGGWARATAAMTWHQKRSGLAVGAALLLAFAAFDHSYSAAVTLGVAALGCAAARWSRQPRVQLALWLGVLLPIAYWQLPLFLGPMDLAGADALVPSVEGHYSNVLGAGRRLAAGLKLWDEVRPNYGLFWPAMIAAAQRLGGSFDAGSHVDLLRAAQLLACLGVAALAWALRPRDPWLAWAVLLSSVPRLSDISFLYFPNLGAMRALGFLAALGLMVALRRRSAPTAWAAVGAAIPALLTLNPETGFAASAGLLAFLWAAYPHPARRELGGLAARMAGALLASTLLLSIGFRLASGQWPVSGAGSPLGFMRRFVGGYGGLPLQFDLTAAVLFLFAAHSAAQVVLGRRRVQGSFPEALKLALAVTLLLWGSYYVNRPAAGNLRTHLVLFGFLVADSVRRRALQHTGRLALKGMAPLGFAVWVAALAPPTVEAAAEVARQQADLEESAALPGVVLEGVRLTPSTAARLIAQAEAVRGEPVKGGALYFTVHSFLMPALAQRPSGLPFADTFLEVVTHDDFERLVAATEAAAPARLYFDAQGDSLSPYLPFAAGHYRRLRERLGDRFRLQSVHDGWEVWERVGSPHR